jgi:hypothetical protein
MKRTCFPNSSSKTPSSLPIFNRLFLGFGSVLEHSVGSYDAEQWLSLAQDQENLFADSVKQTLDFCVEYVRMQEIMIKMLLGVVCMLPRTHNEEAQGSSPPY